MSNTVITNYTDLNGPSTKADSSVVVIVNKDGSLSVDQNLLGTLMGNNGSQGAGISVVRVGHEGKPDDATDSESDDEKVPHVTLSVDSYYDEPDSIIKYDSGAEMLQSLRIETRENSLLGFQNDHCYTSFTSPEGVPQRSDSFSGYDEPVIEITHTPPPKPVPQSKKITILEQKIIPKDKKIVANRAEASVTLKSKNVLNKPLPVLSKTKHLSDIEKSSDNTDSSSAISSGESIPDRESDSDYKDTADRSGSLKSKKSKVKPRLLKHTQSTKASKLDAKVASRIRSNKSIIKKEFKKSQRRNIALEKKQTEVVTVTAKDDGAETQGNQEASKIATKQTPKSIKKDKKPPAHVSALLSDMTSLFSTPDVIRRVSADGKTPAKSEKEAATVTRKSSLHKITEAPEIKLTEGTEKAKVQRSYLRQKVNPSSKGYDLIPQIDDASLAQILQDTTSSAKAQPGISAANTINSPGLAGPLSPTLDLLGGLQPEEEGLTEDLLMHVAQLVESSENLQEVIDKQVLGKVDSGPAKNPVQSPFQQSQSQEQASNVFPQTPKSSKSILPRKDPIEIIRRDGRVITLPPIEAPATRSSKRKTQGEAPSSADAVTTPYPVKAQPAVIAQPAVNTPEPQVTPVSKQYINKKLNVNKQEQLVQAPVVDKVPAESQESWNSEDDPYRLWCICKQPHNNRFMICCDSCEDWFHGKCVNITKAMGQQMEEQGIEWRCPNCVKKTKGGPMKTPTSAKTLVKITPPQNQRIDEMLRRHGAGAKESPFKTGCIVCKRPARASSIYCSDACILKHAQDSLGSQGPNKSETDSGKTQDKQKSESRVIVYERKTGRLLAGPNAPTAENLKTWLQKNPTFEVVRPGALSTIRPNLMRKKPTTEPTRIQTTLNFERLPRKLNEQTSLLKTPHTEKVTKVLQSPKEEVKPIVPQPRTPASTRAQAPPADSPRPSTSSAKMVPEPKKPVKLTLNRSQSSYEKQPSVSPSTPRRKEAPDAKKKMDSTEPIRDNVRKSLQEQMSIRMAESSSSKFTEKEIQQFSVDTELELYELFGRDVGIKYKAKYRSLMFNIKDRKNLSLWRKICDHKITPKQLVRLSPEEMASQELAEWRDQETKHQLELIKKSELDLLAASKTYVLKTHKGEEVMETKESVTTELDQNVPVEDVVTVLNDTTVGEGVLEESLQDKSETPSKESGSRKRGKDDTGSGRSKKSGRESKRDVEKGKSRSSRRGSGERRATRHSRRATRDKSRSRDKSRDKRGSSRSRRHRSRSRDARRSKSKRRSRSRSRSGSRRPQPDQETRSSRDSRIQPEREMRLSRDVRLQPERETRSSRDARLQPERETRSSRDARLQPERETRSSRDARLQPDPETSSSRDAGVQPERETRSSRDARLHLERETRSSHDARLQPDSETTSSRDAGLQPECETSSSHDVRLQPERETRSSRDLRLQPEREKRSSRDARRADRAPPPQRSRSQDAAPDKLKHDSTDSDSIERPKSAMLKEAHPEYDPHEPMITSALSEEDLRKSGADSFDESYKSEIVSYGDSEFDPSKSFSIDDNIILPSDTKGKLSEAESDQEPSSTVDNAAVTVWNGCVNMVDVARFYVAAHEVSGYATDLEEDLTAELDVVGRINPDTVWDYIGKMKRTSNKDIVVLKLQAANDEEKMQYIALYSYLSSRNRLGVVKVNNTASVKDLYIVPLGASAALPSVLLPLEGAGLGEPRAHLLLAIVIRQRRKRHAPAPAPHAPPKVARELRKRSYTPPLVGGAASAALASPSPVRSSPRRRALPLPAPAPAPAPATAYTSPALSTTVKDKIAASLACADDDEPYSPGSSTGSSSGGGASAAPSTTLRTKMEELNRQIEEQKQQIMKMAQADSSVGEEEAYSPSRPMTPPEGAATALADIALPSNLHEILATIKQRSETAGGDVDMRNAPPAPAP